MKKLLLIAVLLIPFLGVHQVAAATSYPLTCRGGAGLKIHVTGSDSVSTANPADR